MLTKSIFSKFGIARKNLFGVLILLLNTFTWWYIALGILIDLIGNLETTNVESMGLWTVFYVSLTISTVAGSALSLRFSRLSLIYGWLMFGGVTSFLPALLSNPSILHVLSICILWGISFGIGIPSCLAYFAGSTHVENRGRMGGIVFLFANLCTPLLFTLFFGMANLVTSSIALALWRGLGLIAFFLLRPEEPASGESRKFSVGLVLGDRSFILYLVAWIMFCFIDYLEGPILKNTFGTDVYQSIALIEPIIAGVSALVGGLLCDQIGRKRMVIYGFVAMGVAYAFIGFFPRSPASWYLYSIVDGFAWGLFMVVFILTIWGDLAKPGLKEIYYLIGSIPFFLVDLVRILSTPYILLIPEYAAFSLASFFLFLAVLPLMYAPETLPQRKIELRRLRKYVEKAKKIREGYSRESTEN